MSTRPACLDLPVADAVAPMLDRRVDLATLDHPWLVQRFPRAPLSKDTLVPDDWPDLGPILDLMNL